MLDESDVLALAKIVHGQGSIQSKVLGYISEEYFTLPMVRPDSGDPLIPGDMYKISTSATLPLHVIDGFTGETYTISNLKDTIGYMDGKWEPNLNPYQNTYETPAQNPSVESLDGSTRRQSGINEGIVNRIKNLRSVIEIEEIPSDNIDKNSIYHLLNDTPEYSTGYYYYNEDDEWINIENSSGGIEYVENLSSIENPSTTILYSLIKDETDDISVIYHKGEYLYNGTEWIKTNGLEFIEEKLMPSYWNNKVVSDNMPVISSCYFKDKLLFTSQDSYYGSRFVLVTSDLENFYTVDASYGYHPQDKINLKANDRAVVHTLGESYLLVSNDGITWTAQWKRDRDSRYSYNLQVFNNTFMLPGKRDDGTFFCDECVNAHDWETVDYFNDVDVDPSKLYSDGNTVVILGNSTNVIRLKNIGDSDWSTKYIPSSMSSTSNNKHIICCDGKIICWDSTDASSSVYISEDNCDTWNIMSIPEQPSNKHHGSRFEKYNGIYYITTNSNVIYSYDLINWEYALKNPVSNVIGQVSYFESLDKAVICHNEKSIWISEHPRIIPEHIDQNNEDVTDKLRDLLGSDSIETIEIQVDFDEEEQVINLPEGTYNKIIEKGIENFVIKLTSVYTESNEGDDGFFIFPHFSSSYFAVFNNASKDLDSDYLFKSTNIIITDSDIALININQQLRFSKCININDIDIGDKKEITEELYNEIIDSEDPLFLRCYWDHYSSTQYRILQLDYVDVSTDFHKIFSCIDNNTGKIIKVKVYENSGKYYSEMYYEESIKQEVIVLEEANLEDEEQTISIPEGTFDKINDQGMENFTLQIPSDVEGDGIYILPDHKTSDGIVSFVYNISHKEENDDTDFKNINVRIVEGDVAIITISTNNRFLKFFTINDFDIGDKKELDRGLWNTIISEKKAFMLDTVVGSLGTARHRYFTLNYNDTQYGQFAIFSNKDENTNKTIRVKLYSEGGKYYAEMYYEKDKTEIIINGSFVILEDDQYNQLKEDPFSIYFTWIQGSGASKQEFKYERFLNGSYIYTNTDGESFYKIVISTTKRAEPVLCGTLEFVENKVNEWSSTPTDTNYPSEKLVKDSLNNKEDIVHYIYIPFVPYTLSDEKYNWIVNSQKNVILRVGTSPTGLEFDARFERANNGTYYFTYFDNNTRFILTVDETKQVTRDNGTQMQLVSNKVNSWEETPSNTKYPSEKLVKDSLDSKEDETILIDIGTSTSGTLTSKQLEILNEDPHRIIFVRNNIFYRTIAQSDTTVTYYILNAYRYTKIKVTKSNGAWEVVTPDVVLENSANKITSITSSSTDTQYPSAKTVYTALNAKLDMIDNGNTNTTRSAVWALVGEGKMASIRAYLTAEESPTGNAGAFHFVGYKFTGSAGWLIAARYTGDMWISVYSSSTWSNWKSLSNDLVTSWSSVLSDKNYPSEKLVKDSLDMKEDKITEIELTGTSGTLTAAQKELVVNNPRNVRFKIGAYIYHLCAENSTQLYFSNNQSDYERDFRIVKESGSWTQTSNALELTSHKKTAWSSTPSDTNYPSEKLVKASLDNKLDKSTTADTNGWITLDNPTNVTGTLKYKIYKGLCYVQAGDLAASTSGTKQFSSPLPKPYGATSSFVIPMGNWQGKVCPVLYISWNSGVVQLHAESSNINVTSNCFISYPVE